MEVVPTTKTALDPSTVSAPRFFDGYELEDSSPSISNALSILVVLLSVVVCDP